MNGLVIRWVLTSVALWLTSRLVSGIVVDGVLPLVLAAIVLGFVNAIVRPLVLVLTLPFNILTLGLLTFVINGAMLKLTAGMVPGFRVEGFWAAVGGAILLSVISFLLSLFISDAGRVQYIYVERVSRQ